MESGAKGKRGPGRPLSFDRGVALRAAMLQFWRTGYETTSVAELTAAMGITAPSLYAAFGDKEGLFLEALRLYTTGGEGGVDEDGRVGTAVGMVRAAGSARAAAEQMLRGSAMAFTEAATPAGCLMASAAATGSAGTAAVRAALAAERRAIREAMERKGEDDVRAGRLPAGTRVEALAAMTLATIQGMSTMARDGADRAAVLAVAEVALGAWPAGEGAVD